MQPLGRRLGADLGHTGHVVHGVANQGLVVDHQPGRHAKLSLHTRHVAALVVHGVDDGDVLIHQLRQVFVAARDDHLHALGRGQAGQRANHVVGLHAGHIEHLPAHELNQLVDGLDLAAQVVGHGRALGLVGGVERVAKGGAFGVKDAGREIGAHVFAQLLHHVDHAAHGPSGGAARVARRSPQVGHGMKGAVQVAGTVHQQQCFFAHGGHCPRMARRAGKQPKNLGQGNTCAMPVDGVWGACGLGVDGGRGFTARLWSSCGWPVEPLCRAWGQLTAAHTLPEPGRSAPCPPLQLGPCTRFTAPCWPLA